MTGPDDDAATGPVLVVGAPRSGTTLVQLMLHAHPRLAVPPENRFVLPTYQARLRFGDLRCADARRELARFMLRPRWRTVEDFGLDRDEVVAAVVAAAPTVGSAIAAVFGCYADRFGAVRWGDKRPVYYQNLEFLLRLFPRAHVVHVVRDPRDAIASLGRMPWATQDVHHAIARWGQAMAYVDGFARRHPGVVTEVRYEDLVVEPERELRRLCAGIGEPFAAEMVEPHRIADVAVPERKSWHANTYRPPSPDRIGSWRGSLPRDHAVLCEWALGSAMRRRGYELTCAGAPSVGVATRYRYVRLRRELAYRRRVGVDRLRRLREPNPVALIAT